MNINDDQRLTAYVLNELPAGERDQVEALLRDDESARRVVEEIRATAGLLSSELKNQSSEERLTDAQRHAIATTRPQRSVRSRFVIALSSGLAAAAMVGLVFYLAPPSLNRAREVAMSSNFRQIGQAQSLYATAKSAQDHFGAAQQSQTKNAISSGRGHDEDENAKVIYGDGHVTFEHNPFTGAKRDSNSDDLKSASTGFTAGSVEKPFDGNDAVLLPADGEHEVETQTSDAAANSAAAASNRPNDRTSAEAQRAFRQKTKDKALEYGQSFDRSFERQQSAGGNTESYARINDNSFLAVAQNPLSTFSIEVDTASYSNIRRFINEMSQLPPKDAVRIEEMLNYFPYSYPAPQGEAPFGAAIEVGGCPWNSDHRLVRIALKGKEIAKENRPPSNLVFLIDVSGSMSDANKLPLLKSSMQKMVRELRESDRVAIVVYAGNSGLVLPSTVCDEAHQQTIIDALGKLEAGGSTNGGAGIQQAYEVATANFIKDGTNRVILCTDGDFNVGVTSEGDLTRLIEEKAKSNVFLSVLGFGMGNIKDSTMEKLADKGNGNYAYIDNAGEANKVLVDQMSGTLITIAKDVKIQVEFNPAKVSSYRLLGYEKRILAKEDFNDDKKDAGEIGAGHTVTAMYEIALVGAKSETPAVDPLKYQPDSAASKTSDELLTVKLRYKAPDAPIEQGVSKLLEFPVKDSVESYAQTSKDFKFASAVAGFGMVLRDSQFKGNLTLNGVIELAQDGRGEDEAGYRGQFIEMVRKAKTLSR